MVRNLALYINAAEKKGTVVAYIQGREKSFDYRDSCLELTAVSRSGGNEEPSASSLCYVLTKNIFSYPYTLTAVDHEFSLGGEATEEDRRGQDKAISSAELGIDHRHIVMRRTFPCFHAFIATLTWGDVEFV